MPDSRSANAAGELFARRVAADAPPNELGWVRDLYDVASLPDSWQRFLACVCDLMDASVAAIAIRGAGQDGNRLRAIYVRGPSDAAQNAELFRRAGDGNGALRLLPAVTSERLTSTPIFSVNIERQDPDCLFKQLGVRHLLVAGGSADGDKLPFITVGRTAEQQSFGSSDTGLLETLLPHLQRAIQLADMVDQLKARVKASAAVLDLITVGVVIFDEHGERALANQAARNIFDSDSKILRQLSAEAAKMRDAARPASGKSPEAHIVHLPAQGGTHPLFAIIWDLPDEGLDPRHNLAFIVDPAQEHNICIDQVALQRLYGLTSTEARVAALLAKGDSVAEIADFLGNTAYTIRTHLRHIFDKTGTARQVDLVHLLLRSLVALQMPAASPAVKLRT
jgi:DNA-binding CsgD family transcriptional regulator/PAS domain-containing protein